MWNKSQLSNKKYNGSKSLKQIPFKQEKTDIHSAGRGTSIALM